MSTETTNPFAITGFTIRKLFGYLNYTFPNPEADIAALSKLTVFYGENGTGKTTILKLAYHLFSPRSNKGHRSFIAKIPFQEFEIKLQDGTRISASRKEPIIGTYSLAVQGPITSEKSLSCIVTCDEKGDVPVSVASEKNYQLVVKALRKIAPTFFFLTDDRSLELDYDESDEIPSSPNVYFLQQLLTRGLKAKGQFLEDERQNLGAMVEAAVLCVQQWIQYEVNRRTAEGFASVHSIYSDVIKRIASPLSRDSNLSKPKFESRIQQLRQLGEQSRTLQEYGFLPQIDSESLIRIIEAASPRRRTMIARVITPYIEGGEAQFKALTDIYFAVHTYFDHLNAFLAPKVVRYNLNDGTVFISPAGTHLHPGVLSSGERHLILLLSVALLAANKQTIFIIDEPEISLNIKWQRTLLKAMLDCSTGKRVQFLMASHSLPIIALHKDHVNHLTQVEDQPNRETTRQV